MPSLVATIGTQVVGFLGVVETSGDHKASIIDLVGVDKSAQGRGVGKALVNEFVRRGVGRVPLLEVSTQAANDPSIGLYERCGFRFAGAQYVLHAHMGAEIT